jgi:hypothetical protein
MRTRSFRNLSLNKLRSELIQNKKWKEEEASKVEKDFGEIRRQVNSYSKEKYKLYLEAKGKYEPTLRKELDRWFLGNKKLIHDLQSKIEEHAPPNFLNPLRYYAPREATPELLSLLRDPSKWPIPDFVWGKEIEHGIELRTEGISQRIAGLEREIVRREEAKARKATEGAKLVCEAERKSRMKNLSKDSRSEGNGLRRLLSKNHPCPYCGGSLGSSPRADHIYPIHKGGRSTFANMVYICNDCNSKKGKMTLQQFISKYKLNREQIERTLLDLNKEF